MCLHAILSRNCYNFTQLQLNNSTKKQQQKKLRRNRKLWEFYGTEQEDEKTKKKEESKISLTSLTASPAIARELSSSNHVLWVLCAFPKHCPSLTALVHIRAVSSSRCQNLIERVHVDPLGRRPFLSLDHGTSTVKAQWVRDCVWVEVEEQQSIPFLWFHW